MVRPASTPPTTPAPALPASRSAARWATRLRHLAASAWRRRRDARAMSRLPAHEMERLLTDTWAERRAGSDGAIAAARPP